MADLNSVMVTIGLDPKTAQAFLTQLQSTVQGAAAHSKVGIAVDNKIPQAADQAKEALGGLGGIGVKAGLAIGAGLAVAKAALEAVKSGVEAVVHAVSEVIHESIAAAAEDEKSASRLKATLGELAEQGESFVKSFSKVNLGIKEAATATAVSEFYNIGKSIGFSNDESLRMAESMIKLAGNMKKVSGDSFETTLGALRTQLLRGGNSAAEYGIRIKEVDIQNEAARLGFISLGHELTQEELAIARLNLIQAQSGTIQDQAGQKTATLAGIMGQLHNQVEELLVDIGKSFLDALKPYYSALRDGIIFVRQFVQENLQIGGSLTPVLEALGPLIKHAFEAAPLIFKGLGDAVTEMANIFFDMFEAITGITVTSGTGFTSFRDIVVGVINKLNAIFEDTTVIKVLAVIKGTVIALTGVFGIMVLETKIGLSALTIVISGVGTAVGYLMKAIGVFSSSAKEASVDVLNFATALRNDAIKTAGEDSDALVKLAEKTADGIDKAKDQYDNPERAVEKYKKELALKRKAAEEEAQRAAAKPAEHAGSGAGGGFKADGKGDTTAADLKKTLEARKKATDAAIAEEEKLAALRAEALDSLEAERAALAAKQEQALKDVTDAETIQQVKRKFAAEDQELVVKYERKRAEEVKSATASAVEAEYQLEEARAKSTETLDDDIAAMRKRQDAELSLAKSEEARAQLRRKHLAQETNLLEEAARKQEESIKQQKANAKALDEFLNAAKNTADRRSGKGAEVDVREAGDKVRGQLDKVDSPEAAKKLKQASRQTLDNVTNVLFDEAQKAEENAQKARDDFAKKKRSGFKNTQERRDAENEVKKAEDEARSKADAFHKADEQSGTLKGQLDKEIDAKAKAEAEKQAKAKADLERQKAEAEDRAGKKGAPGEEAKPEAPQGVLEQLANTFDKGINGVNDKVSKMLTTAQDMLNGANLLPDIVNGLDAMIDGQTRFSESLTNFGATVVDKLTAQATRLNELSATVDEHTAQLQALGQGGGGGGNDDLAATGT